MGKDFQESMIRVNQTWVPLEKYRVIKKAARRREIAKGVCFIILITVVLFGLLWGLP